jgi:hypothetical protein
MIDKETRVLLEAHGFGTSVSEELFVWANRPGGIAINTPYGSIQFAVEHIPDVIKALTKAEEVAYKTRSKKHDAKE